MTQGTHARRVPRFPSAPRWQRRPRRRAPRRRRSQAVGFEHGAKINRRRSSFERQLHMWSQPRMAKLEHLRSVGLTHLPWVKGCRRINKSETFGKLPRSEIHYDPRCPGSSEGSATSEGVFFSGAPARSVVCSHSICAIVRAGWRSQRMSTE